MCSVIWAVVFLGGKFQEVHSQGNCTKKTADCILYAKNRFAIFSGQHNAQTLLSVHYKCLVDKEAQWD